jgi:hypothetical protein
MLLARLWFLQWQVSSARVEPALQACGYSTRSDYLRQLLIRVKKQEEVRAAVDLVQ